MIERRLNDEATKRRNCNKNELEFWHAVSTLTNVPSIDPSALNIHAYRQSPIQAMCLHQHVQE
jgi:hypothetical protein